MSARGRREGTAGREKRHGAAEDVRLNHGGARSAAGDVSSSLSDQPLQNDEARRQSPNAGSGRQRSCVRHGAKIAQSPVHVPAGRWCNGPCGRFLQLEEFPSNGNRPGLSGRYSRCRGCHRVSAREEARRHYSRRAPKKLRTMREKYWSDPAFRAARLATSQRCYERRKLRGAAALSGLIRKAWEGYRERVVHTDAGPVQVELMRESFYAGANALFYGMVGGFTEGDDAEPADLALMDSIKDELDAFLADFKRRHGLEA